MPGRGAGAGIYPECFGSAKGNRDNPILKGEGGIIHCVILYVEFLDAEAMSKVSRGDQRSKSALQSHSGFAFDRKKLAITPHRMRPGGNLFASESFADRLIVVSRFKRAKIEFTNVDS